MTKGLCTHYILYFNMQLNLVDLKFTFVRKLLALVTIPSLASPDVWINKWASVKDFCKNLAITDIKITNYNIEPYHNFVIH